MQKPQSKIKFEISKNKQIKSLRTSIKNKMPYKFPNVQIES